MFFFFSKILWVFVQPLVWIIAGLIIAFVGPARLRKRSLMTTLILLLFFSNAFIFNQFARLWEPSYQSQNQLKQSYDYGIVLSGMAFHRGDLDRVVFRRSSDRLWQALELYKSGIIKKILITGGPGNLLKPDEKESVFLRQYLIKIGIPESDILIEWESRNTRENALFTKNLLHQRGELQSQCLLITSAFHIRRALACFQKVGLNPDIYPTDQYYEPSASLLKDILLPEIKALYLWEPLLHEWAGFVAYKMMRYI